MDTAEYTPPGNFSCHSVGVFRSSFPARKNFSFLKALRLKSILYLCPEEYPETNLKFCEENGINLLRFPMEGNKEPMMEVPEDIMHSALSALIDVRNHPILIHCNAGKHRTGAVSGCLRRLQGWALTSIFYEYNHFADDKGRLADQLFIELYRPVVRVHPQFVAEWFEPHCGVTIVLDETAVRSAREGHYHGSAVAAHVCAHAGDKRAEKDIRNRTDHAITTTTASIPVEEGKTRVGGVVERAEEEPQRKGLHQLTLRTRPEDNSLAT